MFSKYNKMKPQEQKRKVILELHSAGNSAKEIIASTKYPSKTVYRVVNKLKAGEGIEHKLCGPSKRKKRTKRFVAGLRKSIEANPALSMTVLASRRSVSRMTVSRAIKDNLELKSFIRGRRHLLTDKMKTTREERAKLLRRVCKANPGVIRLFSDESIFTVDGAYNPQNDRWLAPDRSSVPPVMRTKNPAKIMIFGLITSDGKVMPPHIFPSGLRVNTDVYVKLLEEVVFPWLALQYPPDQKFMWIQDSAPAHVSKKSMTVLNSKFHVVVQPNQWPSNSPDLNPCDF